MNSMNQVFRHRRLQGLVHIKIKITGIELQLKIICLIKQIPLEQ